MGCSCLRFLGLPAFSFSLPPVLRFCRVPSPYLLGSAASTSAPVLSGVQCPASRSASGSLALSLSLCLFPCSPYLSLLFVPLPLLHLSLDLWVLFLRFFSLLFGSFCGFCSGVFGSSGSGASFLSWLLLSFLSPLVSSCCLRSSPGFWLFLQSPPPSRVHFVWCFPLRRLFSVLFSRLVRAVFALPSPTLFLLRVSSSGGILEFFLSLPSLLLLLCFYWVLFILSTSFCWLCSPNLCFPFSSSWAFVPWACACRVLFSGSVGVPLTC